MKHTIIMPDLGQTTSEAKVVRWLKDLGDKVSAGEPLLEVETDKATMEVEAYVGGYLRKKLAEEGNLVSAMSPIAILTDAPEEALGEEPRATAASAESPPALRQPPSRVDVKFKPVAAVPAARARAKELGIELASVPGTGPNGVITRADVEGFAAGKQSPASEAIQPGGAPKALAAMASLTSASKSTIPHFYVTTDLDVTRAEAWRSGWNASHPELKVSINDYLVRAASQALFDSPRFNMKLSEGQYIQQASGDILLVVDSEAGLMLVPLADPRAVSIEEFVSATRFAVDSARQGRVAATASRVSPLLALSNLGRFGVKQFAAIIPSGCTGILATGAVHDQLILKNGQPEAVKVCSVTLSADHRVVDGITAAKLLERMQSHLNSL